MAQLCVYIEIKKEEDEESSAEGFRSTFLERLPKFKFFLFSFPLNSMLRSQIHRELIKE